jgi:hypothetical protein
MTPERKQMPMILAAMMGIVMSDPEALLAGYALAVSKGDEDSLEIAEFFKERAKQLGVTEDEFINAADAMKKTDELIARLKDEAS